MPTKDSRIGADDQCGEDAAPDSWPTQALLDEGEEPASILQYVEPVYACSDFTVEVKS